MFFKALSAVKEDEKKINVVDSKLQISFLVHKSLVAKYTHLKENVSLTKGGTFEWLKFRASALNGTSYFEIMVKAS